MLRPLPHAAEPLRAFIYDRNSHLNPRGGTSIQDQRLDNIRFCESQGWTPVAQFDDEGISASRFKGAVRPGFEQMLVRLDVEPVYKECDVVVIWEPSRGYRNTAEYIRLRDVCTDRKVLLCLNGSLYDLDRGHDRFITGLGALTAELEADHIRDRILRTTRLNAERGRPHGRIPYGYRRVYDPQTRALLRQEIDEEQAQVVREIARRVAGGQSLSSIRRDLQERGVPAPHGSDWTLTTLRNLMTRPTNIGKRQHKGEVVGDARWDPILDEETYYACLKVLSDPGRLASRDRELKHWLAGVPECGRCMLLLAAQPSPMRSLHGKDGAFRYVCRACYRVSARTEQLEAYVAAAVLARIEQPSFAAALRPDVSHDAVRVALAQAEALEAQLADARRLAATVTAQGRLALSVATLAALEAQLQPMIEDARARALEATVPPVVRHAVGPGARERWEALDLAQRRALVRALVRVVVFPVGRGFRGMGPARVLIAWRV